MGNIKIRRAGPSDFEQVYMLIREFAAFIKTPEKVLTSPSQMTEDQQYFNCLIAEDGEKIVGFATFFYAYYSWTGKAIYLDDLYVTESYRGKGIGAALFDHVIELGRSCNCKKMRWQVSNWNSKAIAFYRSRGAGVDDVEINCDLAL
jgi:diamine N-acetyltransferase